jgi:hypothetical protein
MYYIALSDTIVKGNFFVFFTLLVFFGSAILETRWRNGYVFDVRRWVFPGFQSAKMA